MKNENPNPDDATRGALLATASVPPPLPPRFQENVWRRIENSEATAKSTSWLDALVALILRPKIAFGALALLLFTGGWLGVHEGAQVARHDAQARYLAVVAPNSLR